MSTFLGSVYMVEKKSMLNFITTGIGAVINVVLNFLFIPIFGVNGAAFATFLSYFVVFVLRVIDTRRFIPMHFHPMRLTFNTLVLLAQAFIMIHQSVQIARACELFAKRIGQRHFGKRQEPFGRTAAENRVSKRTDPQGALYGAR